MAEHQRVPAHLNPSTRVSTAAGPHHSSERVTDRLGAPVAWLPQPGPEYRRIIGELIGTHQVGDRLTPDATLAALAIEHDVTLASTDTVRVRVRARFPS